MKLDSSNEDYHANRTHLSSSGLKLLLKDPQTFYQQYVLNLRTEEHKTAFDEGSLTHSLILEPHKIASEYAFFQGLRKQGSKYEEFKSEHTGRKIMSVAQKLRCESFLRAYEARSEAVRMLSGGLPEHTMISSINDVAVKARADYINIDQGYIVDVKTTSYASDVDTFRNTLKEFKYDLSAALYCQIAKQVYGKDFHFYFVVISKTDLTCDIYLASDETIANGTMLVLQSLLLYKKCSVSGLWQHDQPKAVFDTKEYEIVEV